jgi:site-specific recombinase XerD
MNQQDRENKGFSDVDFWLAEWLKPTGRRRSEHTAIAYRADVAAFLKYVAKPFDQVEVADLQNYQSYIADEYGAEKTRARKMASVCSFYKFLNNREVTKINLARIERAKIDRSVNHDELLTPEQVRAVIAAAAANPLHHALLKFLYLTGARISEALGLRWRDLRALEDGGEAHIMGKGGKRRVVYLSAELWRDLMALRGSADEKDHPFPFGSRNAWKVVKKAGKAAGVEDIHPHQFRHAFVSHLLAENAPLADVSEAVGHASIATTGLYAHPTKGRDLASKLKAE